MAKRAAGAETAHQPPERAPLDRVEVVIPVHDEEELLPRCLIGLREARRTAEAAGIDVGVTVVLDACSDRSAAIAAAAGVRTVPVDVHNVGRARAAGYAAALDSIAGRSRPRGVLARIPPRQRPVSGTYPGLERVWLATTDGDSVVPPDWLVGQLAHAHAGADMVLGTVVVDDWSPWPEATRREYLRRYRAPGGNREHPHVHGANLGIRATLYQRVKGFANLQTGEDHALVAAATAAGARIVGVLDLPVVTSSRPSARAPHGFSEHLHHLAMGNP